MSIRVSTAFEIHGFRIVEERGMVRGITVRSPTISQGVMGGMKSIVGGKIGAYAKMCEQAREHAYAHMIEHGQQLGANAIIGVRYDASEVVDRATEVLCYGTAVVIEPL